MISGLIERHVEGFDGTRIAYQACGDGPAIVLANGLGGNASAWRFLFERLSSRYRVISWDYRGLFHSAPPRTRGTLAPQTQARDLEAVLAAEQVDRFALVGWSMGVQVSFEVYRAWPERVAGLAAINGVAGRPFDTAMGWRFSRHVLPALVSQFRRHAPLAERISQRFVTWPHLLPVMRRLGMVGPTLDAALFLEVAAEFVKLDYELYGETMEELGRHDAWDVLPRVSVPVSIITGDRDLLTPVGTARRMASAIPHARLRVLRGGTHYTPVEFPAEVGEEVEALLARADL